MSDISKQKELMKEFAVAKIIFAALHGNLAEVDRAAAVDRRAINFQEPESGVTALHVAAGNGDVALTRHLLMKPGIDVAIKDRFGRDALDLAIEINADEIVELLSRKLYPKSFARLGKTGPDPVP